MSARIIRCLLFIAVTFVTIPVQADWLCDFLNSFPQETKRRNCWPQPFTCPDRQAVRAPFAIEVGKGWEKQNLLGEHYFAQKSGDLNEAGRLKIRWITFEAPSQHRAIYVRMADTLEETSARMNSVEAYVAELMPEGGGPSISQTRVSEPGWPADRVESISRKYQATTPTPRLPQQSSGGSGEGGNGGGGS